MPSWSVPFTLRDGESNDSGLLDPGTYSIAETPIPGWSPAVTVDGEAKDPSAIVLEAGQTITVLFTNTESHVVVQKVSSPSGSSQDFTFHPSWGADFTLHHGQSNDSGPLAPGSYTLTEDAIDGSRQVSTAVDQNQQTVTRGTDGSFTLEAVIEQIKIPVCTASDNNIHVVAVPHAISIKESSSACSAGLRWLASSLTSACE